MNIQARSQADVLVEKGRVVERIGTGFADGVCSG
jgi:hypothetical protein